MDGTRNARSTAAALLVGSSLLAVLGAAERWGGVCTRGGLGSDACLTRQDHQYDQLLPTEPWVRIGVAPELLGLSVVLLAVAVALMPAALGRRSTRWQQAPLALSVLSIAAVGATTLAAGLADQVVMPPGIRVFAGLYFLALPFLLPLALFPRDADGRPVGPLGGLAVWMLVLAMPFPQFFFWAGFSYDTAPWTEAGVAGPLIVVALLLRPWQRQSDFSNQQRAHALSL